ncbi:MAG: M56 family metallopeptidase [Alistipes sp.]|nr:M56 family metallopeptidase [Alistipes sp.]
MYPYLAYALKVIVCSGILYTFYKLLIEGKTGYIFCRVYLLTALLAAASIPLMKIGIYAGEIIEIASYPSYYSYVPEAVEYTAAPPAAITPTGISAGSILGFIYLTVAAYFTARITFDILRVGRYTARTKKSRWGGLTIYEGQGIKTPFTFFKKIFLPEGLDPSEREQILAHEASHARHNHGVKLLLMEFVKSWQWFNPFAWLSRRSLEEVHEYQADNDVLKKGYDMENYKNLLFRQLMGYSPDISSRLACSKTKKNDLL